MENIFVLTSDTVWDPIEDRLVSAFGRGAVHKYTDTFFLVSPADNETTCEQIATLAGVKGKEREFSGVVFKLDTRSYSGYTKKTLWEWLKSHGE